MFGLFKKKEIKLTDAIIEAHREKQHVDDVVRGWN